jgi:predicted small secreted protein
MAIFAEPKSVLFMKKVMISLLVVAIAAFVFTSCASSKRGMGCPTSSSNKPFRA